MTPPQASHVVVYPHPIRQVWAALTESAALAKWLWPNDFEPRLGHRFIFTAPPTAAWNGVVECEVIALEEPRHLAFTWCGDPMMDTTTVTFALESIPGGTRLHVRHVAHVAALRRESSALDTGSSGASIDPTRLLHWRIDEVALTDALFAFLTAMHRGGADQRQVRALRAVLAEALPVLESMALEGLDRRPVVAHYVHTMRDGGAAAVVVSTHGAGDGLTPGDQAAIDHLRRLVRLEMDERALAEALYAYVRHPDAHARHALAALHDIVPDLVPVLEAMILDGVDEPGVVADYLHALAPDGD